MRCEELGSEGIEFGGKGGGEGLAEGSEERLGVFGRCGSEGGLVLHI